VETRPANKVKEGGGDNASSSGCARLQFVFVRFLLGSLWTALVLAPHVLFRERAEMAKAFRRKKGQP